MYNLSLYNRTGYNTSLSEFVWNSIVYGTSDGAGTLFITRRFAGAGTGETGQDSSLTRVLFFDGYAQAETTVDGTYVRVLFFATQAAAQAYAVAAGIAKYDKDTFTLTNVGLTTGDELIIDTDKMTVLLNGVSVLDKLDDDSIFFNLKYGANDVVVTGDDGTDTATIKVTYRDRWL